MGAGGKNICVYGGGRPYIKIKKHNLVISNFHNFHVYITDSVVCIVSLLNPHGFVSGLTKKSYKHAQIM